jgi:hypothetical protein
MASNSPVIEKEGMEHLLRNLTSRLLKSLQNEGDVRELLKEIR